MVNPPQKQSESETVYFVRKNSAQQSTVFSCASKSLPEYLDKNLKDRKCEGQTEGHDNEIG